MFFFVNVYSNHFDILVSVYIISISVYIVVHTLVLFAACPYLFEQNSQLLYDVNKFYGPQPHIIFVLQTTIDCAIFLG